MAALALSDVLTSILSAASSDLIDSGAPTGLTHLAPGAQVAWDDCCESGGQLWIRVIEMTPTVKFPTLDMVQQVGCGVQMLAVHLGLGTVRCAHTVSDSGNPPTSQEMTEDTVAILHDEHVLLNFLVCTLKTLPGVQAVKVERWLPQGPEGGCAGGEWGFYIAYNPCLCT